MYRYIILIIFLITSSYSFAVPSDSVSIFQSIYDSAASVKCRANDVLVNKTFSVKSIPHISDDRTKAYYDYNGCLYYSSNVSMSELVDTPPGPIGVTGLTRYFNGTWFPVISSVESSPYLSVFITDLGFDFTVNPSLRPSKPIKSGGTGSDVSGGSTGVDSGISGGGSSGNPVKPDKPVDPVKPVKPDKSEKPFVFSSTLSGLLKQLRDYEENMPRYPNPRVAELVGPWNAAVPGYNSIYDRISNVVPVNKAALFSVSDNYHFLTKTEDGVLIECSKASENLSTFTIAVDGEVTSVPVTGRGIHKMPLFKVADGEFYLGNLFGTNHGSGWRYWTPYCIRAYKALTEGEGHDDNSDYGSEVVSAIKKFQSENKSSFNSLNKLLSTNNRELILAINSLDRKTSISSSVGSSSNIDNTGVINSLDSFHSDVNKNHKELLNNFNYSDSDFNSLKSDLSPELNSVFEKNLSDISDSYSASSVQLKSVFDNIDSYIPDIKFSFELPEKFKRGVTGKCVPLVFDFNIALVGIPDYHFLSVGAKACQLYDNYIRSIVEWVLYFITAFSVRQLFTRFAEFLTLNN